MRTVALYLGAAPETGGTFHYARTLLDSLAAEGDGLRIVAISHAGSPYRAVAESLGFEWVATPAIGLPSRLAGKAVRSLGGSSDAARRTMSRVTPLGRLLDSLQADLVIYTEYEHFAYELATPSLIPIHDLMHRYESSFSENLPHADADRLFTRICEGARGVLVDSDVGREQLLESYPTCQAEVFVLPYIPAAFILDPSLLPDDPDVESTLAKLPAKYLFYPAQFWEHKNHIRLIDAALRVRERHPDMRLVLAGSPKNHYDTVVSHIAQTGAADMVTMLGYISDSALLEVYRRARGLVMPTFYGPTNIPPLEAMALGVPVATSRIYGIPAQLGDAALLFDPANTDEIAAAVETLWADDSMAATLIARGHAKTERWGATEFAARLREIVDACLEPQAPLGYSRAGRSPGSAM